MLNQQGYIDLLSDKNRDLPEMIYKHRQLYYGLSLHIDGVYPYFQCIRDPELGWINSNLMRVYPNCYCGAQYQFIFETFLFSRHPKEPEIIRQWRLSQYMPFQKAVFLQSIQMITGGIFQDSGYQINIENKEDNDYIWGNNFDGRDLVGYLSTNFQNICGDPNGVFVIIPKEASYATSSKRIEPKMHFIHSKWILWHNREEIVFQMEDIYWAVNAMGYFRFIEQGDKFVLHPEDAAYGGYFAHFLGYKPITVAGGQWNSQGYYDSWLDAGKSRADNFVKVVSAENMVDKDASHPWIISAADDCPECNGTGKYSYCAGCNSVIDDCSCDNKIPQLGTCSTCSGSGNISRNPGQWQIVPYEQMDRDTIKVISPPVDINKLITEKVRAAYDDIRKALHLYEIDEAQSGTAKEKDMESRYQFYMRIANDCFDRLLPDWLNTITSLRNVSSNGGVAVPTPGKYEIVKPSQFNLKTEQDLLDEQETLSKTSIPDFVKKFKLIDYIDKSYGGNALLKKMASMINRIDSQSVASTADLSVKVLNNAISNREWQLHEALPGIMMQIVDAKGEQWFLKADYDRIKTEIDTIFDTMKPIIPAIQPSSASERVVI